MTRCRRCRRRPGLDRRPVRQGAAGRGVAAGDRQRAVATAGGPVEGVDVGPGAVVGRADGAAGGVSAGADRDPEDGRRRRRRRCWSRRRWRRCRATWVSWSAAATRTASRRWRCRSRSARVGGDWSARPKRSRSPCWPADAPFPSAPDESSSPTVTAATPVDAGGGRLMGGVVLQCARRRARSTSTTSGLALAASMPAGQPVLFAECDPSGGDLAAWAELSDTPGWSTAVAAGDRSWAGLRTHLQEMPSGLSVLLAPTQARAAAHGGARVGGPVRADAGLDVGRDHVRRLRPGGRRTPPAWLAPASLVLLLVRQAPSSAGATVARVDRAAEVMDRLPAARSAASAWWWSGSRPYDPRRAGRRDRRRAVRGVARGSDRCRSGGRGVDGRAWRVAVAAGSGRP